MPISSWLSVGAHYFLSVAGTLNVTDHPTGQWVAQQLREAFQETCPYRYAILDRDAKFGQEVTDLLIASGMKPKRISPASPWQNGVAERWVGSCAESFSIT